MESLRFFVSTDGNDGWSGGRPDPDPRSGDGPFRTLMRARDEIRLLKQRSGGQLTGPVAVQVRGGVHRLAETLLLRAQDGGGEGTPVVWEAFPGERPVISGAVVIAGWEPWKDGILRAPAPPRTNWHGPARQLFYRGERMRRSRWPKFDRADPRAGGWIHPEGPVEEREYLALRFPAGSLPRSWAKPRIAEACIYGGWGWCRNTIPILEVDRTANTLRLGHEPINEDEQPWYFDLSLGEQNRFYVENVLEELSEPGEWCSDPEEGVLYFRPPGTPFDPEAVEVPVLDCLVRLRDAAHVTLRGLSFTGTTTGDDLHRPGVQGLGAMLPQPGWRYCGEALHLRGTRHCTVEECLFESVGGNAIYLERGNVRASIRRNEIARAGANGVVLAGDRPFHPTFCEVTDNDIHHAGVLQNYVAGVFLGLSDGCLVAHNRLHDLPHHAVNLGSNGIGRNYVEYNEIRRVCLEIADTGAINCWMDTPGPWVEVGDERSGHLIRWNLIVDVPGCRVERGRVVDDATTRGIYLDDYTSNCLVVGNLIVRAGMGFQLHAGKHNVVENNIVVDCLQGFHGCDWPPLRAGNEHTRGMFRGNRFCRNIVCSSRPDALPCSFHAWTDLVLERCDENVVFLPRAPKLRVQWQDHPEGLAESSWEEWRAMGFDRASLIADPRFVDPGHGDYRLQPDSPALALGFQPLPLKRIGIRPRPGREA